MQAGDLREGDDLSASASLDRARVGTILVKRKMGAVSVVVVDVRGEDAAQMALVEDHDVVETPRRIEPITCSTYAFCQDERGAAMTSVIPIA
jgi:hypothetical protein